MADRSNDRAERDAEDTDELHYTDLNDTSSVFGLDHVPLKLDHCDLLLDAIDAQLGQMQLQPQKHQAITREHDCNDAASFRWSQTLSKDTGLGSTAQTNDTPLSCLDLIHTQTMDQTSEGSTGSQEASTTHERSKQKSDRRTRNKMEMESRREQVIWRLERLLGDTCKEEGKMTGETHPPSDSICTEDFVRCFREEMVKSPLPEGTMQHDKEEEAQRTEISDSDIFQSEQKEQKVLDLNRRGTATTGKSSKDTYCQLHKPDQRKELERCLPDSSGLKMSHKEGAGGGSLQNLGDYSSISYITEIATERENMQHNNICSPKARCLAGVPVWSFDSVSIDSDLDTVCTEQVRQHIHRQPGWRSFIESVRDMDDLSDNDTLTQEESEPQATPVKRFLHGNVQNRGASVRSAQRSRRETYRLVCSLSDADKDTDEEINHCSRRCRPGRTSEKMQSNWEKMKERLSTLRQKCDKEEERLQLKKTQLTDVELSLSELQQRRKHALQELEQLTAETAQMETEKRTLVSILKESKAERESIRCQLQELQKQRESSLLEVRGIEEEEEELATQYEITLKEKTDVVMSVLEREEMERQLDSAKTELFSEQRHSREKLESIQEKLEETLEELQRVTESERSLRSRCSRLEEKQRQKKEQTEALECQACELQGELGERNVRVGTLEKMLAQKELQLLDLQEKLKVLQAERDELKGELQHLKTQHYNALKEAPERAHNMIEAALKQQKKDLALAFEQQIQKVNKQAEDKKAAALKEQAQSLTQHIESLQSSLQLKEEEAKKLIKSLEQEKEEAKRREEQLHVEALEKVHKAIEEERGKWEVEKVEAVQVHCGILEEQNRQSLERTRSEMQREKNKALDLQHKVVELQRRVQELESESCVRRREQESLLSAICKSLKEEHQVELQRLQTHMAQESQRTVLQLEKAVQLAEKEANRLRVMLEERESSYNQATAKQAQQLRHWAQELEEECEHLHLLMEQRGTKQSTVQLPASPTVAEGLTNLKKLRDQLKHLISYLYQKLDSLRQTTELLSKDKERELSIQRKQLRIERDQALDSLKERLIQEHIEELTSLNWAHMCDGGGEEGGAAASLRKQLKAKDLELRQVQKSMSQWKEKTVARLACKFEEELTAELERKMPKTQEGRQDKSEKSEGKMKRSAMEAQDSVCSPLFCAVDSATFHNPSDVASLKLLRYLQSRVKQLRVENQTYACSQSPLNTCPSDLSGSYLKTITQCQDISGNQSHSSIRTVSS